MTVAIGNEICINIGPAVGPGSAGNSGSGGDLLPGAAHLSGRPAGSREGGTGSGLAESFRARWQSELATIHSAGQGDGRGEQTAAGDADAAIGRETKSDAFPGFAGVNVPPSRQAGGAKDSISASGARNSHGNSATPNSEINGRDDAPGETRLVGSAERPESKDTQNSRGARNRETHGQTKADSQNDTASLQSMTGASMEMLPLAVAQQQIQTPALTAGATASSLTGAPGVSAAGKAAGDTKNRLAIGGGLPANAHPGRAVQPLGGLAPGGAAFAAGDEQATVAGSESVAEDGAHSAVSGSREGPHVGFIGEAAGDGGRGSSLPAATAQGTHEAGANAEASTDSAAGAQGYSSQSTIAAASNGAADAGREAVAAARPGHASNAVPSAGQNPKQIADTGSAAPGHEGSGMAIAQAVGATHGMSSQPAGAAAGASDSGSGNSPDKGAGETFAAMDAQANSSGLTWVHAGAHQAEAGFQDPALGWVSVRAEMGAGGVHAAIVPGSADAAQMLGGHMAGLSAHLAEQRIGVTSVSMNNPGNSPNVASQLAGGGAGQNGYSNPGQGQHQPADTSGSYVTPTVTSVSGARATAHHDGGTRPVVAASGMTGRHISVVA